MPEKPQWRDCPDKQRTKVPDINLAIKDLANPCQLAKKFGVPLSQLRAYTMRDGATNESKNDFFIARNRNAPTLSEVAREAARRRT
jgi:hypothetical protein